MFRDTTPIAEFRGPFGIPVQIGGSILILVLFYLGVGGGDFVYAATLLAILIGSIFLHELGHGWAAQIQGVPVRRIMIYGGGGFCEQARSATAYEQELIIAMGPIVNLVIWAVCSIIGNMMFDGLLREAIATQNPGLVFGGPRFAAAETLLLIAHVNGFLAIFNLMPVQPLDGGRLLHLLLLRFTGQRKALRVTGSIGLVFSVLWVPALFLVYGAGWWILFFIPSIPLHWAMAKGRIA